MPRRTVSRGLGSALPNQGRNTIVFDWSSFSSLQNQAGTVSLVTLSGMPEGATKALRVDYNATPSFGQQIPLVDFTIGRTSAEHTSMGMWVLNTSSRTLGFELRLFNVAATQVWTANMAVLPSPNWQFLVCPRANMVGNGSWVFGTDVAHFVRMTQQNTAWPWQAGDTLYFGPVTVNAKSRSKFMFSFDDGRPGLTVNPGDFPAGYPASGGNHLAIMNAYGFKGTAYIIPGLVGTAGYTTWSAVDSLAAAGWSICAHSGTNPTTWEDANSRGLANLGPNSAQAATYTYDLTSDALIYSTVSADINALVNRGYSGARHYALPQGGWDDYVRTAVTRAGALTVRGISLSAAGSSIPVGKISGGGFFNGNGAPALPSVANGWMDWVAADMETSSAVVVQAYIDELIRTGASGGGYMHAASASNQTKLDTLCAYLRAKQRAGEIDVITQEQWYQGSASGRLFG